MNGEIIDEKGIAAVRQEAEKVIAEVKAKHIRSEADMEAAKFTLSQIATAKKQVQAKKDAICKPLNESLKAVRAMFAPIEDNIAEAEMAFKASLMAYKRVQDAKMEKMAQRVEQAVQEGKMDVEEAGAKLEKIEKRAEAVPTRKTRKVRVIDLNLIPDKYWVIDDITLRRDVLAGEVVPGAEIWEDEVVVSR